MIALLILLIQDDCCILLKHRSDSKSPDDSHSKQIDLGEQEEDLTSIYGGNTFVAWRGSY
jgi:hypothetical protein